MWKSVKKSNVVNSTMSKNLQTVQNIYKTWTLYLYFILFHGLLDKPFRHKSKPGDYNLP